MQIRLKRHTGLDRWALIEDKTVYLVTEDPTNRGPLTTKFSLDWQEVETIFEATGQRLPPMIWLQMDEGEPWHLFGDLDTVAACGAAITTSRPHVEERTVPEHACPACVDHAKERGLGTRRDSVL